MPIQTPRPPETISDEIYRRFVGTGLYQPSVLSAYLQCECPRCVEWRSLHGLQRHEIPRPRGLNACFCQGCRVAHNEVCANSRPADHVFIEDFDEDNYEEDDESEGFELSNYSSRASTLVRYVRGKETGREMAFGIEIELLGDDRSITLPDGWIAKPDASISSDDSAEFVSPPATLRWWRRELSEKKGDRPKGSIARFLGNLEDTGWGPDSSCGMHIHVSRSRVHWSRTAEHRLVRVMATNRRILQRLAGPEREPEALSRWAAPCRMRAWQTHINTTAGRYHAANFCPRTIEFRLFQSTTNPQFILSRIVALNALHEYVHTTPYQRISMSRFLRSVGL